jgi:hypothetical protein
MPEAPGPWIPRQGPRRLLKTDACPQKARARGVAPIFGSRCVAKLVRSARATACAWLLAIFRKLTATWHTWVFQQSPRL